MSRFRMTAALFVFLAGVGVCHAGDGLPLPGFENAALWKSEVAKVVEEGDRDAMVRVMKLGKSGRLDGLYSTNYAHYLRQVLIARPALFLSVARELYPQNLTGGFAYVINESEGYRKEIESALQSVKKDEKEYPLAQEVLKWASRSKKGKSK